MNNENKKEFVKLSFRGKEFLVKKNKFSFDEGNTSISGTVDHKINTSCPKCKKDHELLVHVSETSPFIHMITFFCDKCSHCIGVRYEHSEKQ